MLPWALNPARTRKPFRWPIWLIQIPTYIMSWFDHTTYSRDIWLASGREFLLLLLVLSFFLFFPLSVGVEKLFTIFIFLMGLSYWIFLMEVSFNHVICFCEWVGVIYIYIYMRVNLGSIVRFLLQPGGYANSWKVAFIPTPIFVTVQNVETTSLHAG